ncbi:hypothetical protein HDU91_004761 [Kappamyces sp. JEL0680]|nr:hypothetical protein HDU91_004761 [Kappamyces sp. JEL0680]
MPSGTTLATSLWSVCLLVCLFVFTFGVYHDLQYGSDPKCLLGVSPTGHLYPENCTNAINEGLVNIFAALAVTVISAFYLWRQASPGKVLTWGLLVTAAFFASLSIVMSMIATIQLNVSCAVFLAKKAAGTTCSDAFSAYGTQYSTALAALVGGWMAAFLWVIFAIHQVIRLFSLKRKAASTW